MHLRNNYRIRFFAMLRSFSVILSISEISNFEILHCVLRLITIRRTKLRASHSRRMTVWNSIRSDIAIKSCAKSKDSRVHISQ